PLYVAIPHRHTNRFAYDVARPIPRSTFAALDALADDPATRVFWFTSADERQIVARQLVAAAAAIGVDREQAADNGERWLRIDRDEIARHRDGLTLNAMGLSWFDLV